MKEIYRSPLGELILTADGAGLTGLYFADGDCPDTGGSPASGPILLDQAKRWLDVYFSGREPDFRPPLHWRGTAFQERVWTLLLGIPWGETRSYGELAARLARDMGRMSAQAVGGAVGRNPISILVPCHRVVGSDGSLTGYAGGLEKKRFLLRLEGVLDCAGS